MRATHGGYEDGEGYRLRTVASVTAAYTGSAAATDSVLASNQTEGEGYHVEFTAKGARPAEGEGFSRE